jgi:nicotinamidase-related amidase
MGLLRFFFAAVLLFSLTTGFAQQKQNIPTNGIQLLNPNQTLTNIHQFYKELTFEGPEVQTPLVDATRKGDNQALIIIDMQEPFITRGETHERVENVRKVNEIVAEQLRLIEHAKSQGMPIVFLEYENFGPTNPLLTAAVSGYSETRTFQKTADGMFEPWNRHLAELSGYLQEKEVGNLIITGANGGACVASSISGALENNYSVTAMSRAIADFNFEDFMYPYDDQYTFPARCPQPKTCTFREVDDFPILALGDTVRSRTPADAGQDNSKRERVPADRAIPIPHQNGATQNAIGR